MRSSGGSTLTHGHDAASALTVYARAYGGGVIVLDTNQLEYAQPPDGPLLAMLQTVAKQAGQELWLPEMALEEHLAHYRNDVAEASRRWVAATKELRRLVPSLTMPELHEFRAEAAVIDRASRLKRIFRILGTPDAAWKEALMREAQRKPPARTSFDGPGAGARDVSIWLTAVSACQDRGEDTYFVAADDAAFGKQELRPELADELVQTLGGNASKFHYCRGVEGLLEKFATKVGRAPGSEQIAAAGPVRGAVETALDTGEVHFQLIQAAGMWGGTGGSPGGFASLALVKAGRTVAYRIGDSTWACAQPTWQAGKDFSWLFNAGSPENVRLTFNITTTVVMQLSDDEGIVAAEVTGRSQVFGIRRNAGPARGGAATLRATATLTAG